MRTVAVTPSPRRLVRWTGETEPSCVAPDRHHTPHRKPSVLVVYPGENSGQSQAVGLAARPAERDARPRVTNHEAQTFGILKQLHRENRFSRNRELSSVRFHQRLTAVAHQVFQDGNEGCGSQPYDERCLREPHIKGDDPLKLQVGLKHVQGGSNQLLKGDLLLHIPLGGLGHGS